MPDTAPRATPTAAALPPRVFGVLTAPRATLAAAARVPRPAGVLMLATVVALACGAGLFSTEVGRLALVDQWERTATAFGQPVDDAAYAQWQTQADRVALPYGLATALAAGPLATLAAAVLARLLLGGPGAGVSFLQLLAVSGHAGVILAVRQLVVTPLDYVRETLASPVTLALLLPVLDEASPLARFAALLDLFVVWWAVVLAIGLAGLYGRRTRPLLVGLLAVYLAIAVAMTLAMALAGGTA